MSLSTDSGKHLQCTGEGPRYHTTHMRGMRISPFRNYFGPFVQRVWVAFEYLGIPCRVYAVLGVVLHLERGARRGDSLWRDRGPPDPWEVVTEAVFPKPWDSDVKLSPGAFERVIFRPPQPLPCAPQTRSGRGFPESPDPAQASNFPAPRIETARAHSVYCGFK